MSAKRPRFQADRVILEPAARRAAVLAMIRQARARLDLSLFRCNDLEVLDELGRAVRRGVDVNVLVTSRSKGRRKLERLRDALDATGATLHAFSDPVVKYHAKYMVVDDGPAMVASMNFTRKCFTRTLDALVLTFDAAVVAGLRQLRVADSERVALPPALSPRLIVAPERARAQLDAIISGARSSIRIIDPKLSDPALTDLLRARRVQHLRVETHGAARLDGLRAHGKIMLVDDRLAVIGGLALTALSLDFRREVALTVDEPRAVAVVRDLFARADQTDADRRADKPARARSIRARLSERP